MKMINCKGLVTREGAAQMRTLLSLGWSVSRVARACRCARSTVRAHGKQRALPQRPRCPCPRVRARQFLVAKLIRTVKTVTGTRTIQARGRPSNKPGWVRKSWKVSRKLKKLEFASPNAVSRELCRRGINASPTTVRRDLAACELKCYKRPRQPPCTAADAAERAAYCRKLLRHPLSYIFSIVFTDEKIFDSNDHGCRFQYLRRADHRAATALLPREQTQYPPTLHVWGLIGIGLRKLVVIRKVDESKGLTSDQYVEQCLKVTWKGRGTRQS